MNFFTYNGKSSRDFGIFISGEGTFGGPERDVTLYDVPGRNGSLLVDNGRFKNITIPYPAFIRRNFKARSDAARAWLLQPSGYVRLEDTYHPEFFRLARFVGPLDFTMRFLNYSGEVTLQFDAKPQRFLRSGGYPVAFTSPGSLINDYLYDALPLITVYGDGDGALSVGGTAVTVTDIDGYVVLDCDTQNAYKGTQNKNSSVQLEEFPRLKPGENEIGFSGGITGLEIVPRWWTL